MLHSLFRRVQLKFEISDYTSTSKFAKISLFFCPFFNQKGVRASIDRLNLRHAWSKNNHSFIETILKMSKLCPGYDYSRLSNKHDGLNKCHGTNISQNLINHFV